MFTLLTLYCETTWNTMTCANHVPVCVTCFSCAVIIWEKLFTKLFFCMSVGSRCQTAVERACQRQMEQNETDKLLWAWIAKRFTAWTRGKLCPDVCQALCQNPVNGLADYITNYQSELNIIHGHLVLYIKYSTNPHELNPLLHSLDQTNT